MGDITVNSDDWYDFKNIYIAKSVRKVIIDYSDKIEYQSTCRQQIGALVVGK